MTQINFFIFILFTKYNYNIYKYWPIFPAAREVNNLVTRRALYEQMGRRDIERIIEESKHGKFNRNSKNTVL